MTNSPGVTNCFDVLERFDGRPDSMSISPSESISSRALFLELVKPEDVIAGAGLSIEIAIVIEFCLFKS